MAYRRYSRTSGLDMDRYEYNVRQPAGSVKSTVLVYEHSTGALQTLFGSQSNRTQGADGVDIAPWFLRAHTRTAQEKLQHKPFLSVAPLEDVVHFPRFIIVFSPTASCGIIMGAAQHHSLLATWPSEIYSCCDRRGRHAMQHSRSRPSCLGALDGPSHSLSLSLSLRYPQHLLALTSFYPPPAPSFH